MRNKISGRRDIFFFFLSFFLSKSIAFFGKKLPKLNKQSAPTVGTYQSVRFSTPILLPLVSPCVMTCCDDVGTTDPDKSESKRYLVVPNCFLGCHHEF